MSSRFPSAASLAALPLAAALAAAPARAQTYDFESTPVGTTTPFSVTSGGVTATFTTTGPPDGYVVATNGDFVTITGNFLAAPTSTSPLDAAFSAPLSAISLAFATHGPATLSLSAFLGAALVGSVSDVGTVPAGHFFPEGMLSFSGASFDRISLVTTGSLTQFVIDDVVATPAATAVPEPASLALAGSGLAGLAAVARRRRAVA